MNSKSDAAPFTFALAIFMFIAKIIRIFADYPYPIMERFAQEYLIWDYFELIIFVPALLAAGFLINKRKVLGSLIAIGISSVSVFQWGAVLFGMINIWSAVLIIHIALAGTVMITNWRLLPQLAPMPRTPFSFFVNSGISLITALGITALYLIQLIERMSSGAPGVDKAFYSAQPYLDYSDATLNEPLIYFIAVIPLLLISIINLPKMDKMGYRTALSANVFLIVFIFTQILTGPIYEFILLSSVDMGAIIITIASLALLVVFMILTRKLVLDHEIIGVSVKDGFHTGSDGYTNA